MATNTVTTFAGALKVIYTPEKMKTLISDGNPLLDLVSKDEKTMTGTSLQIPVLSVLPQGVGGTSLATIQSAQTAMATHQFSVTAGEFFGIDYISHRALRSSAKEQGAYLSVKTASIDGTIKQMGRIMGYYSYSNGGLALAQVSSVSSNTITLTNRQDVAQFEPGMTVIGSSTDGSSGSAYSGSTTVVSVQPTDGTITLTNNAAINPATGLAANDYIFRSGDFGAGQTYKYYGLGAWITATDTPAALYGVTRTSQPARLAGCRLAAAEIAGKSIEQRLSLLGAAMTGRYSAEAPDTIFLHPEDWQSLADSMAAKGQRVLDGKSAVGNYAAIKMVLGGGFADVISDRNCPKSTAFALKLSDWKLYSIGKLISFVDEDGVNMLRASTSNDFELRAISYPALVCSAPINSGRVSLS